MNSAFLNLNLSGPGLNKEMVHPPLRLEVRPPHSFSFTGVLLLLVLASPTYLLEPSRSCTRLSFSEQVVTVNILYVYDKTS